MDDDRECWPWLHTVTNTFICCRCCAVDNDVHYNTSADHDTSRRKWHETHTDVRQKMTTVFGLPKYVANLLRQLDKHKDCLKWAVDDDASHKITLTLTWNFRQHHAAATKEKLWERLQRAVTLGATVTAAGCIPTDVRRLLDSAPKRRSGRSRLRRHLEWIRGGSMASLPSLSQSQSPTRHCSFCERAASSTSLSSTKPGHLRYSWPRASSSSPARPSQSPSPIRASTPLTSPTRSNTSSTHTSPTRVKLVYRSEEEVETSIGKVMERVRRKTQDELSVIREQWDQTIREWPERMRRESRRSLRIIPTTPPVRNTSAVTSPVSAPVTPQAGSSAPIPVSVTPQTGSRTAISPSAGDTSAVTPPVRGDSLIAPRGNSIATHGIPVTPPVQGNSVITAQPRTNTASSQNQYQLKVCVHRVDESVTCKQSCDMTTRGNSTLIM